MSQARPNDIFLTDFAEPVLNPAEKDIEMHGEEVYKSETGDLADIAHLGFNLRETLTVDNVAYVLGHPDLNSFNPLSFYIVRSGQVRRGWIANVH